MILRNLLPAAAAATALTLLTVPAFASNAHQSSWHVNMTDAGGTLLGISPVAARVQLDDGTTRTFAISQCEYEKLKGMTGMYISFDVRHDVLQETNA